jgi:hypothetical protein
MNQCHVSSDENTKEWRLMQVILHNSRYYISNIKQTNHPKSKLSVEY